MEKTIYEKLLEAQKEIGAIKRDSSNPFFKSKYFDINAILREVKPILNSHGLTIVQGLSAIEGQLALSTRIFAKDGSFIQDVCPLPTKTTQLNKEGLAQEILLDPQKQGSAITYFRRYALQSLLALEAEDDDGNIASGKVDKNKKNVEKFFEDIIPDTNTDI